MNTTGEYYKVRNQIFKLGSVFKLKYFPGAWKLMGVYMILLIISIVISKYLHSLKAILIDCGIFIIISIIFFIVGLILSGRKSHLKKLDDIESDHRNAIRKIIEEKYCLKDPKSKINIVFLRSSIERDIDDIKPKAETNYMKLFFSGSLIPLVFEILTLDLDTFLETGKELSFLESYSFPSYLFLGLVLLFFVFAMIESIFKPIYQSRLTNLEYALDFLNRKEVELEFKENK